LDARSRLQSARSAMGWASVDSAETALRERIVQLEIALDQAQGSHAEALQRSETLQELLAETEPWIPTEVTRGVANAASDSMRTRLYGEQVDESEALAKLRPDHPRYRLLQEKMSRSREIADEEKPDRELTREAVNPVRQQLESELSLATASASGLESRCRSLSESLSRARNSLLELNEDAIELAELRWQADISEATLMDHARSLEEARVLDELDQKHMTDVTVIQDASLNLKKVGPPRTKLAGVGLVFAFAVGLLQALLRQPPRRPSEPAGTAGRRIDPVDDALPAPVHSQPDAGAAPVASAELDSSTEELARQRPAGGILPR